MGGTGSLLGLPDTPVLVASFLVVLAGYLWYSYVYSPYQYFKRLHIPGPPPRAIDGNTSELLKLGVLKSQFELANKYGPVVGVFNGYLPTVFVTDLGILKQILVKQFSIFSNREPALGLMMLSKAGARDDVQGIVKARGEYWRRSRQALAPTFSARKIKVMEPLIAESVSRLLAKFEKAAESGKSVDVLEHFGRYTMEVILASAFGRYKDIQSVKERDKLTEALATALGSIKETSTLDGALLKRWLYLFPWLWCILPFFLCNTKPAEAWHYVTRAAVELVNQRRLERGPQHHKDLLQLMLDAHKEDASESTKGLTDREIVAHSTSFLIVGYDTTSNALSFTSYLLALHPEVQEKLSREIEEYFEDKPESTLYEASQAIEYLDMVLNESLRMYPPAPRVTRQCAEDVSVKGFAFPKGLVVNIPIYYLQNNPEHWPEPDKFDPNRFTAEEKAKRDPFCFMPFGMGPRNCIGMRFALLEAKMALIQILRQFRLVRSPDTEVPLQTVVGLTMSPKNGLYLQLEKRQ